MRDSEGDPIVKEFLKNTHVMEKIKNTEKLDNVNPSEFGALIVPGGPGTLFDLPEALKNMGQLLHKIYYDNRGVVAAIGHGIAAFLDIPKVGHGQEQEAAKNYWIKGKKLTCISKEEDREMNLEKMLPFILEDKVRERGANYQKKNKFESNVVVDERFVTAQNPQSVKDWVKKIMEVCQQHLD